MATWPHRKPFNSSFPLIKTFQYHHLPVKCCIPGFLSVNALFTLLNGRVMQRITSGLSQKSEKHISLLGYIEFLCLSFCGRIRSEVTVALSKRNSHLHSMSIFCSVVVIASVYDLYKVAFQLLFLVTFYWNILSITTGCGGVGGVSR